MADLIVFNYIFYIMKVVLDWKLEYILLIIENTTGMPHQGDGVCTLKEHYHVSLSNDLPYPVHPTQQKLYLR